MKSDALTVRVDSATLSQVSALLAELGLSTSAAVNMFFKQMLYENGLPFWPKRELKADVRDLLDRIDCGEEEMSPVFDNADDLLASLHGGITDEV
jgi:DNA-damage-inducible protein J